MARSAAREKEIAAPDWRVLLYLIGLAIATGVLFGIVPAMRGTGLETNRALKQARIGFEKRGWSFANGLVATQVALSALLLLRAAVCAHAREFEDARDWLFTRESWIYCARFGKVGHERAATPPLLR
ncbi:MAG TPA: hypothetical protein VHZ55_31615 [Bryobacteraceae bacterium]|nr:hypothetical protein [Bryobacteraceae bacterium]